MIGQGFSEGFHLGYDGPRVRRWADNLKSAKAHKDIVQQKLDKEVSEGRMAGPFVDWPVQELIISLVGLVPKKEPGQFRLIQHLSWPEGQSVNDYILDDLATVSY